MLASEGIPPDRMQHEAFPTFVAMEDDRIVGFFTLRIEHNFPSLQHFCVIPDRRDGRVSRAMMRAIKTLIGPSKLIVHVVQGKEWMKRLVEGYFGVKPYGELNGKYWYLVEVKR
jgi:hypothetical protein